jgi:hypothetical protein
MDKMMDFQLVEGMEIMMEKQKVGQLDKMSEYWKVE